MRGLPQTRCTKFLRAILSAAVIGLTGCDRPGSSHDRLLRVWCNQGQEAENRTMKQIANAFNAAHAAQGVQVRLTFFPDFQYTEKIAVAAAAGDLPDCFNLDGPFVTRWVEAGLLQPLDRWFDANERADFLPGILAQGTVRGRLYALGAFDSAVVLYHDRVMLRQAGVAPPTGNEGWTWEEFIHACRQLKAAGLDPVALHMNDSADEWFTYAFSPVIWSGNGALISEDGRRVRGVLASPENVSSLQAWQELFKQQFAASDPVDPNPFGNGKVAMDWNVHGLARMHLAAKGDRLGVMPLPRIGSTLHTPCGSWCWSISSTARDTEAAVLWLKWVTDSRHGIEPIVRANGAVPSRRSAFAAFPEYAQPPYSLFKLQSETMARSRPRTPHYASLTQGFAAALRDIAHGANVESRLRMAEDEIQAVIDRRQPTQQPKKQAP